MVLSAEKTDKLPSCEKAWQSLQCVLLSAGSQAERATYCVIPVARPSGKGRAGETKRSVEREGDVGRGSLGTFRAVRTLCVTL